MNVIPAKHLRIGVSCQGNQPRMGVETFSPALDFQGGERLKQSPMVDELIKCLRSEASVCVASVVSDSCPMDRSLPGSSVHGILQARILEWVVMPSSGGSS